MSRIPICIVLAGLLGCASPSDAPRSPNVIGNQWRAADVMRDLRGAETLADRSGKGAVLCLYSMQVAAHELGNRCFAGEDKAFQEELARSIARTEAFIIANSSSPTTLADLQARKKAIAAEVVGNLKLEMRCESEVTQLYESFRTLGADGLRASTDDALSIPREPVINPCV